MASTAYPEVSYHATRDDARESIPEVLLHNANGRENSEGDRLSQHSGSIRRNSRDDDIETAIPERKESKSRGRCTNFTTRCMKNPFFICTMVSCIGYLFNRFFCFFSSCWMLADMVLDGRQTHIYYQHSFNPNGTYNTWAVEFNQTSNTTHLHSVSPAYFYTAVLVWFYPPLFYSVFFFVLTLCVNNDFHPFYNTNVLFVQFFSFGIKRPFNNNFFNLLVYVFYFPIDFLISSIMIYILTPFMAIKTGALVALTGKDDPDRKITKAFRAETIPFFKLFENLGEAIPQAILTIVFICNNWDFILYDETSFIPIPTSCISLIFSFGSIIIGLISGCKFIYRQYKHQ